MSEEHRRAVVQQEDGEAREENPVQDDGEAPEETCRFESVTLTFWAPPLGFRAPTRDQNLAFR